MLSNLPIIFATLIMSIFLLISFIVIKNNSIKWMFLLFNTGFYFYSGAGLFINNYDENLMYIFQFFLFSLFSFIITIFFDNQKKIRLDNIFLRDSLKYLISISPIICCLYIMTFIFPFLYPSITITEVFNISRIFSGYDSAWFSLKLNQSEDSINYLITNYVRVLSLPFFYLYLYSIRKKHFLFIFMFLTPIYLETVFNSYISRNMIILTFLFIIIYLFIEFEKKRKLIVTCSIIMIPILIYFISLLFYLRTGTNVSENPFVDFLKQESSFTLNYQNAINASENVSTLGFIIFLILLPIPSFLTEFVGVYPVILPHILTKEIIGLDYGSAGYYILLPSILGEGLMIFNQYFAWVYAIILVSGILIMLKFLDSWNPFLYLKIWFILDVFRQMRGGGQFILGSWINTLVPFLLILIVMNLITSKKK